MTEWRAIPDFFPYEVSFEGEVRNGSTGHILGQYCNHSGVRMVVMQRDRKAHCRAVNRLVANVFIGEEDDSYVPMHIDGNRDNNSADNLVWKPRWFAQQQAIQRKRRTPLDERGIVNIRTGEQWENSQECANATMGIEQMIVLAAHSNGRQSYRGELYAFL